MRIRFYNGRVMAMENGCEITSHEVWTNNETIEYVGASKQSDLPFDREINLEGNLVMPTFKNAHTHSAMTFLRSYADDLPLLDWLEKQVFPLEAKLTADDVYTLSRLAILEYLSSGIGANFDMYMFTDANAAASIDSGFRTVLCGAINDFSSNPDELCSLYEKYNNHHSLITSKLGFHAEYTCSDDLIKQLAKIAHHYKAPMFTHNSESRREFDECIQRRKATPTQFLHNEGIFEYGGGCYHCVHLNDEDLNIFKKQNMWVISNPGSNTKLASGIAPLTTMKQMGINLALGTDGPASNNCLDMFREMFLATGLQKIANDDASAMDALSVLEMATIGGARAMGLTDCDYLAKGKKADLIVINLMRPNMQPLNNIAKNIVYSGSKENIKLTMVNGKILYENGDFAIGEEPRAIYEKANAIINRMR